MAAPDEPVGGAPPKDAEIDSRFDVNVAHIARVYNYWLGGKDHFAADRSAGDATIGVYPGIRLSAQANRAFLARAVLHYIPDLAEARDIVARLLAAVPPGSFIAISHAGSDLFSHEMAAFEKNLNEYLPNDRHVARPREDVALFFESATLLTPGVVRVSDWRPDTAEEPLPTTLWGGVARK